MVPLWVVILLMATAGFFGGALGYILRRPRTIKEVDRAEKKEPRPLNVFDAYSDKELEDLREKAARSAQYYRDVGSRLMTDEYVKELRKLDDEIEARKNTKLALEESRRTQHERDIAIFDTIYGEVLRNVKSKEKK